MQPLSRVQGYGHVAKQYGLEESIFLEAVMYWYRTNRAENRNYYDGRWWTHNSLAAFEQLFPWWSGKQLRRIINSCKDQGAILTGTYNKDRRDRTVWYTPSAELMELYGESQTDKSICPNGQMQEPERADSSAQMGTPLPCNTHVDTNTPYSPPQGEASGGDGDPGDKPKPEPKPKPRSSGERCTYKPDWFDALWKIYPRKDAKAAARKKWDALKPDRETCRAILAGLERDKRSEQWQKDSGKYIPMLSTYLNQRRWEDQGVDASQLPTPPADKPSIAWGEDREVT